MLQGGGSEARERGQSRRWASWMASQLNGFNRFESSGGLVEWTGSLCSAAESQGDVTVDDRAQTSDSPGVPVSC